MTTIQYPPQSWPAASAGVQIFKFGKRWQCLLSQIQTGPNLKIWTPAPFLKTLYTKQFMFQYLSCRVWVAAVIIAPTTVVQGDQSREVTR